MNILGKSINRVFLMVTMLVMLQCCCCVIPIRWRIRTAPRFTTAPPQAVQQVNIASQANETLPDSSTESGLFRDEDLAPAGSGESPSTLSTDRTEADNTCIAGVASARRMADSVRTTRLQNENFR